MIINEAISEELTLAIEEKDIESSDDLKTERKSVAKKATKKAEKLNEFGENSGDSTIQKIAKKIRDFIENKRLEMVIGDRIDQTIAINKKIEEENFKNIDAQLVREKAEEGLKKDIIKKCNDVLKEKSDAKVEELISRVPTEQSELLELVALAKKNNLTAKKQKVKHKKYMLNDEMKLSASTQDVMSSLNRRFGQVEDTYNSEVVDTYNSNVEEPKAKSYSNYDDSYTDWKKRYGVKSPSLEGFTDFNKLLTETIKTYRIGE